MCDPQALGQQQLQLVDEPLAPVVQVRALVRECVLEELFAVEVLEIWSSTQRSHPHLIGQPVNVLEQQQPDHEAGRDSGPTILAIERRHLAVDPVPIDLAGELNQLVLYIDDLVQPGQEQIARSRRPVLLRSPRHLPCDDGIMLGDGILKMKLQGSDARSIKALQTQNSPQRQNVDSRSIA